MKFLKIIFYDHIFVPIFKFNLYNLIFITFIGVDVFYIDLDQKYRNTQAHLEEIVFLFILGRIEGYLI